MKNIILYISILSLVLASCNEPPIKTYYSNGNIEMIGDSINGSLTVYWENGNKAIYTEYSDSLKHGMKQLWYESGELWSQMTFIKGVLHGTIKTWYKNDELSLIGSYKNGVLDGEFIVMDSIGRRIGVKNYLNGKLHGKYRVQNPETNDLFEYIEYDNGKKHGKYLKNFLNGNPEIEMYYKHGLRDSICKEWFESGELRRIRNFSNDTLDGLIQIFYKNGKIWGESIYKNGSWVSERQFHKNGKLKSECNFKNGKRHGFYTYRDTTGEILIEKMYENGEIINKSH